MSLVEEDLEENVFNDPMYMYYFPVILVENLVLLCKELIGQIKLHLTPLKEMMDRMVSALMKRIFHRFLYEWVEH